MKTIDLANLQGDLASFDRRMETLEDKFKGMKEKLEKYMELMVKQHLEENIHKRDNVVQGTHQDKNSVHVEQTSLNKHTLGGLIMEVIMDVSLGVSNFQILI